MYSDNYSSCLSDASWNLFTYQVEKSGSAAVIGEPLTTSQQDELAKRLAVFADTYTTYLEDALADELVFGTAELVQFAIDYKISLELLHLMEFLGQIHRQLESGKLSPLFRAFQIQADMQNEHLLTGTVEWLAGETYGVEIPYLGGVAVISEEQVTVYRGNMAEDLETKNLDFSTPKTSELSCEVSAQLIGKYSTI